MSLKNLHKIVFIPFLLLSLNVSFLQAEDSTAAFRVGPFFPVDKDYTRIYDPVTGFYELEFSQDYNCNMTFWENLDLVVQRGKSIGLRETTYLVSLNGSFGIKHYFPINECLRAYVGIGAVFGLLWIQDYVEEHKHRTRTRFPIGGILKSGINYDITECWFLDGFVDYFYQPQHFYRTVDLGGFKLGLGIGRRF